MLRQADPHQLREDIGRAVERNNRTMESLKRALEEYEEALGRFEKWAQAKVA